MSTPLGWTLRDVLIRRVVFEKQDGDLVDRGSLPVESLYRFHDESSIGVEYALFWKDPYYGERLWISGKERNDAEDEAMGPCRILTRNGLEAWHVGPTADLAIRQKREAREAKS